MSLNRYQPIFSCLLLFACLIIFSAASQARDLSEIQKEGVLRHIGVPYANFITLYQEGPHMIKGGMDIELIQGFAKHIGVKYQFIPATWSTAFTKLTGQSASYVNGELKRGEATQNLQGDIIANGVTILPWREQVVDFSTPYFPSAVWLIARADSSLQPIIPSGSTNEDIKKVKNKMDGRDVLAMKHTCLDPDLYNLSETKANVILPLKQRKLNEMVPAILNNDAESTLLDVPDTLIALQKWPGQIKVIGPVSQEQEMAAAFRKQSPQLRDAFNAYLKQIQTTGEYQRLVEKYYPSVFYFYADFFEFK